MTSIKVCQSSLNWHIKQMFSQRFLYYVNVCLRVVYFISSNFFNGSKSFYSIHDKVDPRSIYGELKVEVERWIKQVVLTTFHPSLTKVIPDNSLPPLYHVGLMKSLCMALRKSSKIISYPHI